MKNYAGNLSAFVRRYYFFLLLFILISARMAVVIPSLPRGGLDPSWGYGLSAATSGHLIFGKDVIYTFGPLSSVYTGLWSPEGHVLTVILSVIAAFSLSLYVYKIFEKSEYSVKLLLILFFFLNVNSHPDFFFTILPAVASLVLIDSTYSNTSRYQSALICLLGFNSAMLLLVKMSFGAESVILTAILLTFYGIKKDRRNCLLLMVSFIVSFILLYSASGQGLSNIFYFALNVYYGIAGFNDGMSNPGGTFPVISTAVFLLFFNMYFFCRSLKPFKLQGIFTAGVLALTSLIVFKQSFIRHDDGHSGEIYLYLCFLFIYLLHFLEKSVIKNCLITACALSLLVLMSQDYKYYFNASQINNAWARLISRAKNCGQIFNETRNEANFRNSVKIISRASPLPLLEGTSDLYNYNQAVLLASGNSWNPRPGFQSFQAVSPYLARANYNHLVNKDTAPDNIFFRVETIDHRFPSLDDGLSWKALLGLYKPYGWTEKKDYLILRRNDSDKDLPVKDAKIIKGRIGHEIVNPYDHGLVFVKLHLGKSLPGALLSVVYKTEPVWIRITLQNGREKKYRIIPSMSETGFLLSPLTVSTADFSNLYKAGYSWNNDSGIKVKSLTIYPEKTYQYSDSFDITFEQLGFPDSSSAVSKLQKSSTGISSITNDASVKFHLESFAYKFIGDGKMSLGLRGWAFKTGENIQKSSYSVLLTGQNADIFEIPLVTAARKDVSKHFNDGHNYDMSGYSADGLFDASELDVKTEYKLFLKIVINGTSYVVPLNKSMRGS